MPLFELYRMAKRKLESSQERNPSCSTSLSSVPESDFVELVWDNGQIMTQGQSSRTRKNPTSRPSHSPKTGDTDIENGTNTKTGKFGMVDSILNEIPMSMPSGEMGLSQDDEMVCWLNYPMVQSLQTEYRPNFFYELSGVTANELSTQDNFASSSKGSCNHSTVNSRAASVHNGISSDEGNTLEGSIAGDKATIHRNITSPSSPSHTLQFPTSFPYLRARISQNIGDSISYSPASHAVSGDSIQGATLAGSFPSIRMQKQDQAFPNNRSSTMNFSHFLGPAAFVKANLQNVGAVANPVLSSVEKVGSKDKGAAASSSAAETLLESTGALRKETSLFCQPVVQSNVAVKHFETKPLDVTDEPPKAVCPGADSKNNKDPCESLGEVTTKRLQDGEKTAEPAVASSSVCSGNSGERASGDPSHDLKRKHCDIEDSECPSEDVEEESVGAKKVVPARAGRGSKRSRAAEVHNLSERRRRDRINEKMRALQELIPNCNKVDKASMLDEAIEYLKTLQLQVQVMSMGAGLYMPHMMLPAGMQHMHAAHMPHFSPMGVGIGMGMGFGMAMPDMNGGSSGCPMVQLPPTHGAQFPGTPMPIPAAMHGMAGPNFQLFGLPGQGLPMSMPHAPLIPMSGGSLMNPAMDLNAQGMMHPMENLDSGRASSSRNLMQNISPQVTQNAGATSSMKQTPAQCQDCQAMNENSKQPDVVQDNSQLPVATSTGAFKSANRNEDRPQSSLL